MNPNAVPHATVKSGFGRIAAVVAALALVVSLAFAGAANAAPMTKNGKVNACYRVKGKAKGAMRVVPAKKKCRRGERKLAWNVAGLPGAPGQSGANGAPGSGGANGPAGSPGPSNEAALQAKIAGLTVKVEGLEGLLQGVGIGDLSTTVSKLSGVTGLQLDEAVGSLPAVDALCTQASTLTNQVNLVQGGLAGLSLNGILTGLGGLLNIPALPVALGAFTCPA